MNITNQKLKGLSYCLDLFKITADIPAESVMSIVKLKKDIKAKAKDLAAAVEEIMKSYDLYEKSEKEIAEHENAQLANDKIKELMEQEVELTPTNFITMKEARNSLNGLNAGQLELIVEYLVKE